MNSAKHLINVFRGHQTRDCKFSELKIRQIAKWCKWLCRSCRQINIMRTARGGSDTLKGYDLRGTTAVRVGHNADISGRQMGTVNSLVVVFCRIKIKSICELDKH